MLQKYSSITQFDIINQLIEPFQIIESLGGIHFTSFLTTDCLRFSYQTAERNVHFQGTLH